MPLSSAGRLAGQNAGRLPTLLNPGVARFDQAVHSVANCGAAKLGVVVGDQAIPRDIGERWVREVLEAVCVCEARAGDVGVEHIGGVVPHRRHIETVEKLEGHGTCDAGTGEGRNAHGVSAILELKPFVPDYRLVACHVFLGEDAAVVLDVRGYCPRDVALIESVRTALAYCFEDVGEFGLLEHCPVNDVAHGHVVAGHEDASELVVAHEHARCAANLVEAEQVGNEAVAREADGGGEDFVERELSEASVCLA